MLVRDFFRHGSNALLAAALAFFAVGFALRPGAFSWVAFVIGFLAFFVTEYTTHRFLLHAKPQASPFLRNLQDRLHYEHHVTPERLDLLFLPPWFAVPAALAYFGAYLAITRNLEIALALVFGSLASLFYYEWVHYVAHVPFRPRTPFGRWMKKYHLLHHFKNENYWFGVTNPSMDILIGTYRGPHDAAKSGTTRNLFGHTQGVEP
jgi:sterol desaturase/sphingolipid hydroxylase (fatty acid hydroxylase superfamily)